jgi:integrase
MGPSLSEAQVSELLTATERIEGWTGDVAKFVISIYAYTGLRLSELRRAKREDLDTKVWALKVSHPKGEGSYGQFRIVPIPSPIRSIVEQFLGARSVMLARKGLLEVEPLIPRMNGDPNSYYSANHFETISRQMREASGIDFDFRTLRRTYGQTLLNKGVQLQSVSLMLGHATTRTTETYYCRQDMNSAKLEVLRAFDESSQGRKFNPPLIDRNIGVTGYV